MQLPLHKAWPAGHVHAPSTHADPPPHTVPHAPQLALSEVVSTQAPPQFATPPASGHDTMHTAPEHTCS
jgi:hypothetical protein